MISDTRRIVHGKRKIQFTRQNIKVAKVSRVLRCTNAAACAVGSTVLVSQRGNAEGEENILRTAQGTSSDDVIFDTQADYCVIYFLIICIFPEASGYLVPNIIRLDQNYILWGLFGGKNVPP